MKQGDLIIARTNFCHMNRHDTVKITSINYYYEYVNTSIGITVSFSKMPRYFYTELELQRREKLKNLNNYE